MACIFAGIYNGNRTVDVGIDDALIPEAAVPVQQEAPVEAEPAAEMAE